LNELSPQDRRWLDSAVRLARARLGTTGPFAASAALIVEENNQVLAGRGVIGAMGRPSAVVAALADARGRTTGCTAYLTLEPDSSDGPYDAETSKLTEAGIVRVVVGALDPARERQGRGVRALDERGVEVVAAEHEPSRILIEGYESRLRRGRPFVTAVLAVSADGMIAGRQGTATGLLSPIARRWLDVRRSASDALLTSARAAEQNGLPAIRKPERGGPGPLLVVATGQKGTVPASLPDPHLVVVPLDCPAEFAGGPRALLRVATHSRGLDLGEALEALADRGINSVQVEAGARLTEALTSAELIDRFLLLESTVEIGRGGIPATPLGSLEARLRAVGFEPREERLLGDNRLRTFEPNL
jgi:diaminohydroxyphosphoribosylaminopyrimidine deaminase/5-amino-6-(5-phosphoribosylamino)uracil reductase